MRLLHGHGRPRGVPRGGVRPRGADPVRPRAHGPREALRARRPPARAALGAPLRREARHHASRPAAGRRGPTAARASCFGTRSRRRTSSSSTGATWLRKREILRVEECARALAPPKLRVVRASHGVLPDEVWDLERPRPRQRRRRSSRRSPLTPPSKEFLGRACGPGRCAAAGARFRRRPPLRGSRSSPLRHPHEGRVARAKGLFHTTAGWRVHEIAGGRLSTAPTSWRRDSRVDVILKDPDTKKGEFGDFLEWEEGLGDALVPADAPLLTLEDGTGGMRAYDPRGFSALSPSLSKKISLLPLLPPLSPLRPPRILRPRSASAICFPTRALPARPSGCGS